MLFDRGFETLEARADEGPEVRKIRPMRKAKKIGDVRPSLSMPPPCSVRFTLAAESLNESVEPGSSALRLHTAAGIHYPTLPAPGEPGAAGAVRFRIEIDGEQVFEAEQPLAGSAEGGAWLSIGASDREEAGIEVAPGAVVTLHTELVGVAAKDVGPVRAGFATLEVRRMRERRIGRASPEAPNLVLIVMDTLRADRLECYGYDKPTSPRLNALAERGTLFEDAYSTAPWTWPSTASLLTGLWPETHGVTSVHSCFLAGGLETLAEVLAQRGYWTGAFTCNPLIVRDKNFDQGFDEFEDGNLPGMFERGFTNTDRIEPDVLGWLDANRDARFFLYLHLVDTHWPYTHVPEAEALLAHVAEPTDYPKGGLAYIQNALLAAGAPTACGEATVDELVPEAHQDWMRAQYDAAVRSADTRVGTILDRLDALGLDDRTVVVFTSDHGEELLDHGLAAHGFALYEEHVRVPLIVAGPGVAAGRRVEVPVSNRNVAPTLARLGGALLEQIDRPLDLLMSPEERPIFFSTENGIWCGHTPVTMFGVRDGERVWIRTLGALPWGAPEDAAPRAGEGELLFDLAQDPGQRANLRSARAELATQLEATLSQHLSSALSERRFASVAADDETVRMLQDVGYVGEEEPDAAHPSAPDGTPLAPESADQEP